MRRLSSTRFWVYIVGGLAITAICSLGGFLVYADLQAGANPSVVPYLFLLFAIVAVFAHLTTLLRADNRELRQDLKKEFNAELMGVTGEITKLLATTIVPKENRDALRDSIASLFRTAGERAHSDAPSQNEHRREVIIFFGASSVQPKAGEDNSASGSEDAETVYDRFVSSREFAEQQQIRFHRYVRLFDKKNFLGRSPEVRIGYISWLKGQIALMERSGLYVLFDARRAPRWKAIRSSIISHDVFIDILGDAESGFVVGGADFCATQRANALKYINSTKEGRRPFVRYGQENVKLLVDHLELMHKLHESAGEN